MVSLQLLGCNTRKNLINDISIDNYQRLHMKIHSVVFVDITVTDFGELLLDCGLLSCVEWIIGLF